MSIYLTGDTHGYLDIDKLNRLDNKLTYSDYLIILGDFGLPPFQNSSRAENLMNFYNTRNYKVLFIDGNHENFNSLNSYSTETWNGGLVHHISDNIIHLMRGQVYNIDNYKILTIGGAASIDRAYRIAGVNWFNEENISAKEINITLNNLNYHNNKVDFILTHTCGEKYLEENYIKLGLNSLYKHIECCTAKFLDYIESSIEFKHWYFGHYHKDKKIDNKHTCMFNEIKRVGL